MTDTAAGPVTHERRTSPLARLRRLLVLVLGPLWVTVVRDPVREGRLRLDTLSRTERQLARAGLVLLVILLGSMLLAGRWRTGVLLPLGGSNSLNLLPVGVLGLTLLAFTVGWGLVVWGALDAAPSVRLAVAAAYLLCMVYLDSPSGTPGLDSWVMRHGETLVHTSFLTTAAALVVSAALAWAPRVSRVVNAVLRGVVLLALSGFFLGILAMFVTGSEGGQISSIPFFVDGAIGQLVAVSLPLVWVSAIVVVDLALDVSTSLRDPARRLPARWALAVLLAVVAAKLYVGLVARAQEWVDLVTNQPLSLLRTVGSLALLAALVAVVTRFPRSETFTDAKEKVIYLGAFVITAPLFLTVLTFGLGTLWVKEFDSTFFVDLNDHIPYDGISRWFPLVVSVLVIGWGAWLMRRSAGGYGDELGSAMLVVGGWNIPASIVSAFEVGVPFSLPAVDVLVAVGALAAVLVTWARRRTVPASTSLVLATVVVFTWLVMSRGDYISFLGGLLGLSAVVVVVFGVLYSLVSDSAFAAETSKRLPAGARPMLFVGYTLVSVAIIHWVELTHEANHLDPTIPFVRIGVPLAAWLVGRRLLPRPDAQAEEAQAAAVLR